MALLFNGFFVVSSILLVHGFIFICVGARIPPKPRKRYTISDRGGFVFTKKYLHNSKNLNLLFHKKPYTDNDKLETTIRDYADNHRGYKSIDYFVQDLIHKSILLKTVLTDVNKALNNLKQIPLEEYGGYKVVATTRNIFLPTMSKMKHGTERKSKNVRHIIKLVRKPKLNTHRQNYANFITPRTPNPGLEIPKSQNGTNYFILSKFYISSSKRTKRQRQPKSMDYNNIYNKRYNMRPLIVNISRKSRCLNLNGLSRKVYLRLTKPLYSNTPMGILALKVEDRPNGKVTSAKSQMFLLRMYKANKSYIGNQRFIISFPTCKSNNPFLFTFITLFQKRYEQLLFLIPIVFKIYHSTSEMNNQFKTNNFLDGIRATTTQMSRHKRRASTSTINRGLTRERAMNKANDIMMKIRKNMTRPAFDPDDFLDPSFLYGENATEGGFSEEWRTMRKNLLKMRREMTKQQMEYTKIVDRVKGLLDEGGRINDELTKERMLNTMDSKVRSEQVKELMRRRKDYEQKVRKENEKREKVEMKLIEYDAARRLSDARSEIKQERNKLAGRLRSRHEMGLNLRYMEPLKEKTVEQEVKNLIQDGLGATRSIDQEFADSETSLQEPGFNDDLNKVDEMLDTILLSSPHSRPKRDGSFPVKKSFDPIQDVRLNRYKRSFKADSLGVVVHKHGVLETNRILHAENIPRKQSSYGGPRSGTAVDSLAPGNYRSRRDTGRDYLKNVAFFLLKRQPEKIHIHGVPKNIRKRHSDETNSHEDDTVDLYSSLEGPSPREVLHIDPKIRASSKYMLFKSSGGDMHDVSSNNRIREHAGIRESNGDIMSHEESYFEEEEPELESESTLNGRITPDRLQQWKKERTNLLTNGELHNDPGLFYPPVSVSNRTIDGKKIKLSDFDWLDLGPTEERNPKEFDNQRLGHWQTPPQISDDGSSSVGERQWASILDAVGANQNGIKRTYSGYKNDPKKSDFSNTTMKKIWKQPSPEATHSETKYGDSEEEDGLLEDRAFVEDRYHWKQDALINNASVSNSWPKLDKAIHSILWDKAVDSDIRRLKEDVKQIDVSVKDAEADADMVESVLREKSKDKIKEHYKETQKDITDFSQFMKELTQDIAHVTKYLDERANKM